MGGETTSAGVDPADVLAAVCEKAPGTPLTTREVAEAVSCSRRMAYDKLETLAADGDLETKKVGARGRVWWRPVAGGTETATPGDDPKPAVNDGTADPDGQPTPDDRQATSTGGEQTDPIATLEASARTLATSESGAEIGDAVLSTLDDVVGVADAAVYRFETTDNRLVPVATSAPLTDGSEYRPVPAADESAVWTSFAEGEPCIVDATAAPDVPGRDADDGFVLVVPVGEHGTVVATTDERADVEDARSTVELVTTVATMAFDRITQRTTLDEQADRLGERERRLERVSRVTDVLRAVDRAIVRASTVPEVHSAVTTALTGEDHFAFAWIGTIDDDGSLTPRANSGDDGGYIDAVSLADAEGPVEPAVEAAAAGEVSVAENVAEGLRRAPWRREAIARDFQSVLAVPLAHGDVRYGVLAVYADSPGAFGELERDVFAELGATIGNAMDAIATRERLLCDTVVELAFVLREEESSFLSALADATGGEVRFNGVVPVTETKTRLFFTVEDASVARLEDAIGATPGVESVRVVATRADEHLVAVVVAEQTIPAMIVDHEASIRTLRVDEEGVRLVVDLPAAADVRAFIERFREAYPSTEFVARRERDHPIQTRRGFRAALEERLTDRQREVLETAYYSGLYDSPRRSTVGEIAETLGVSQPTVTEHLQSAQAKLFDLVLAEDPVVE